tara:strand:- start:4508 stop:5527 length:1020 start_codon:yes stop_codon:yes gene_type:complete
MKNTKLKICDVTIHPGEVTNLALPLPERYSCAPMYMPIKVIHGRKKGPCLLIFSSLNGDELNGIEIVNRVVTSLSPEKINGTVIAIPIVNVYGLTRSTNMLPGGMSLVDCFPGKQDGTFGERFAYLFTEEILKKADFCIELQTGALNHNILPQVYCNFDNKDSKKLAKVFQAPVVTNVTVDNHKLRKTTDELQIPFLAYEAGEAMRFDENAISVGVNGVINVMIEIGVMSNEAITDINPIFSQDEDWLRAHKCGILYSNVGLGQTIEKNEIIGTIVDPFGNEPNEPVKATTKGIVVGINTTPLIYEGMSIFKITSFLDYDKAENIIEKWDQKQEDSILN